MMTEEQHEKFEEIAVRLLWRLLKEVHWGDCKVSRQLNSIDSAVEEAAARVKNLGLGWEEWT